MTTRLIVARHGNTFGPGDVVTRVGRTDLPLVASGLEQGRMMGRYLKAQGMLPDRIFTSKLQRTSQTAEQLQAETGSAIAVQRLDIFNEIDYGPDENKPEDAVIARLGEDALKAWDDNAAVPDGWNVDPQDIIRNWQDFAAGLLRDHAGQTVLVVTSNGIARFAPYLTGDFESFRTKHKIKIATGALCIFEYLDGKWVCTGWNLKPKDLMTAA
jgi:2,3-bisphosphoglycerate-dependent phosphoglycerate mutase